MHIVAVQLDPVWEDRAANHRRVSELLAATSVPAGALVVLPEMFDTGFSMNVDATRQPPSLPSDQFLKQIASQYDAAVLAGVVGQGTEPYRASNEAVAYDGHGTELVRYRKMQPFSLSGEGERYGRGEAHVVFTWKDVVISPFICYDLRFPELFRPAARDGAELFVVIACWPEARAEHWVRLLQARAIENQAFVVGVNRCGTDPTLKYVGRSVAFSPMGECLFETDHSEQVVQIDIDPQEVRRWRAKFPALRDMR
ncbi:MAG: nitrilase-related carbon-nitrogen hydrolase [Pirellulaceae bacterium]|nr:hypothetical protein [Planctomycetales bacterium]